MAHGVARRGLNAPIVPSSMLIGVGLLALTLTVNPATAQDTGAAVQQQSTTPAGDRIAVSPVVGGSGGGTSSVVVTERPNCVEGKLVAGSDKNLGYVVTQIGPTVFRGSLDAGPSTSYQVVALDSLARRDANSFIACAGAP